MGRICFVADPDGYRIELIDGGEFPTPQDPPRAPEVSAPLAFDTALASRLARVRQTFTRFPQFEYPHARTNDL